MDDRFADALELHRRGQLEEAAAAYEALIAAQPNHLEALYHLSVLRGGQGRDEEALSLARRALALAPGFARAQAQAGGLLALLHRPDEALVHLQRALDLEPGRADVVNNIGAVLRTLGRLDEARGYFERAVALDPGYRDALRSLGSALSLAGRYGEAIEFLRRLVFEGSETAAIDDELGNALWKIGRVAEAERALRRAVELDPGCVDAWAHLGNLLIEKGQLDEAEAALREAVFCAPHRPEFYGFLANVNPSAVTSAHAAALEDMASGELQPADRVDVHLALGRIANAAGERRQSFEHYVIANREKRSVLDYDEAATLKSFEDIANVFSARFMQARKRLGNPSELPVFIIGMPRSGTTLIEQVLASHPQVYGAGELALFTTISDEVFERSGSTPEIVVRTNDAALREIGDRYLAGIAELAPSQVLRVTDKMPNNFLSVGLIALVFPNARIIHARRNPLDNCVSCFSLNFESPGLAWTYDLTELGRYYRQYARLMDHWHAVLPPGRMLDVQYEETVEDLEAQARRILAYCGLEWDPRCLEFYKTKRPVKTASVTQVRKPIYRSSVNRADKYGELLAPLKQALAQDGR